MYFLPLQAQEYDRLRLQAHDVEQLPLIVSDEKSAILWLRRHLGEQAQTYQDLQPHFLRELHQAGHEKLPDCATSWRRASCKMTPAAGMCPTQPTPATWKNCASGRYCASSASTSKAAAG